VESATQGAEPIDPDSTSDEAAAPAAEVDAVDALLALDGSHSTSVGGPEDGRVEGSVALPLEGPGFRFNPRRDSTARFGTVEMVQALVRAAKVVDDELPGSGLTVNDLGYSEGGPIAHHGSHRAGRDVDVLFYLFGPHGRPIPAVGAPLDPDGRGVDFQDLSRGDDDVALRIDPRRTWRFVHALIDDRAASLQRIFVAEHLRTLLLEEAHRTDAPSWVVRRFEEMTCQPSYPHDDHFHFRFYCSAEDIARGCEDSAPLYAWHRRALAELGVEPVRYRRRPDRPEAPIVTHEEAAATAGPMHPAVRAWLRKRRAWLDPPRTGRPFCR
jgi:penicillin-insensitive murein endopeptidase